MGLGRTVVFFLIGGSVLTFLACVGDEPDGATPIIVVADSGPPIVPTPTIPATEIPPNTPPTQTTEGCYDQKLHNFCTSFEADDPAAGWSKPEITNGAGGVSRTTENAFSANAFSSVLTSTTQITPPHFARFVKTAAWLRDEGTNKRAPTRLETKIRLAPSPDGTELGILALATGYAAPYVDLLGLVARPTPEKNAYDLYFIDAWNIKAPDGGVSQGITLVPMPGTLRLVANAWNTLTIEITPRFDDQPARATIGVRPSSGTATPIVESFTLGTLSKDAVMITWLGLSSIASGAGSNGSALYDDVTLDWGLIPAQ